MKAAKLILLASPLYIASMVLVANNAEATMVKMRPEQSHITLASARPDFESMTPHSSQESNPILDQLGCRCAVCVKTGQELQGKLPFSHI
ncbi:hypothetical protein NUACC21_50860 [Scytonema sp. NUACC21]